MNSSPHHDKILDHTRQQLSALIDGELPADEAAFLMRRLEHDDDLTGCFERWQLVGAVLRGQGGVRMPDGFSSRVMAQVKDESLPTRSVRPRRWLQWGGGAIAASVALVALLVMRPAGPPQRPEHASSPEFAQATAPATPPSRDPAPVVPRPAPPDTAAQLATAAVAVAEVPRRLATARRAAGGQAQRAAARVRDRNEPTRLVAAAGVAPDPTMAASTANAAPFSPDHALPSRPWPRALVPGLPTGAFNVDYGGRAAAPQGMYPFEPARLAPQRVEPLPEAP